MSWPKGKRFKNRWGGSAFQTFGRGFLAFHRQPPLTLATYRSIGRHVSYTSPQPTERHINLLPNMRVV